VGAVALAIVGFAWGGWVTAGTAKQMGAIQAGSASHGDAYPVEGCQQL
jgi:hypothetical protein